MAATDQARSVYLVELPLELAREHLKLNGALVVKILQGEGFDEFVRESRKEFGKVRVRKREASRPRSGEMYLIATGLVTGKHGG